ncbi:hypothetical protein [Psychrobacter sp. FDAARGOS_221]|uniref:hypothetical protein n=1 Tax=Psychrobacter sp. FDAARGOS_221 TaxID=1975705 RepID=UPI000BB55787|nr:hypothetical protein [Psychrobacter sp. FDAARGOS_221]PNK60660.1 hypothetical protein A6J60_007085 [Psychrobacter sp. FDAARGOS_221]
MKRFILIFSLCLTAGCTQLLHVSPNAATQQETTLKQATKNKIASKQVSETPKKYDIFKNNLAFTVVDDYDQPYSGFPYVLFTETGKIYSGLTDDNGNTIRVWSSFEEEVCAYWDEELYFSGQNVNSYDGIVEGVESFEDCMEGQAVESTEL